MTLEREADFRYFDLQAMMGTTKHMGGLASTRELLAACQAGAGQVILEVGCGVGATACLLANEYGCRVVGIDRLAAMVHQARQRAAEAGMALRVSFVQAEAGRLPFARGSFDLVLSESVTTFVQGRERAAAEYARVVRARGWVALNEETWLKTPVPQALADFTRRTWEIADPIPTTQGWVEMLESHGLEVTRAEARRLEAKVEASQVRRYRWRDLGRMLWRILALYARSPAFRQYMKERSKPPAELFTYLGYGLYLGRKR